MKLQISSISRHYSIALFASVMGYMAVTVVIRNVEEIYDLGQLISTIFLFLSLIMLGINILLLGYQSLRHFDKVKAEFQHPLQMNFFATVPMSLLLLAVLLIDFSSSLSFIVWITGVAMQLGLTLLILTKKIWSEKFHFKQIAPVSFIPIVGNLIIPIAGKYHAPIEVNWFFFSIGIVFGIVYLVLIVSRLFFTEPLPEQLIPSLFILLAPPSVGFVSYMNLSETLNAFSYILYGFAFFIGLLLIFQINRFFTVRFYLSWWSLLFPLAAFSLATIRMYGEVYALYLAWISFILLVILVMLMFGLTWKTIQMFRQEIM